MTDAAAWVAKRLRLPTKHMGYERAIMHINKLWPQRHDMAAACNMHRSEEGVHQHESSCAECARSEARRELAVKILDMHKPAGHAYRSSFDRGYNDACDEMLSDVVEQELSARGDNNQ